MNRRINLNELSNWPKSEALAALQHVTDLVGKQLNLNLEMSGDGTAFHPRQLANKSRGVMAASGWLTEDGQICVQLLLIKGNDSFRVKASPFFNGLGSLSEGVRPFAHKIPEDGRTTALSVELMVRAMPIGLAREGVIAKTLNDIDKLARLLQAELPKIHSDVALAQLYKTVAGILEPIPQVQEALLNDVLPLKIWSEKTHDFLSASSVVALACPDKLTLEFALGALATVAGEYGRSLGNLLLSAVNAKALLDLAAKAPGAVVVSAVQLSMGSNPYELGNETQALMSAITSTNRQIVFTGTTQKLQAALSGGQGGTNDPLEPVVQHVPQVPFEILVRHAVRSLGRQLGGVPARDEDHLVRKILSDIKGIGRREKRRVLPLVTRRLLFLWDKGANRKNQSDRFFVSGLTRLSETLGGLSPHLRTQRASHVQETFVKTLSAPHLIADLKRHLIGQDLALEETTVRLRMEVLTRPDHQPLRICFQGTPGTGKSESASLIACKLGVPYVTLDASSFSDYHVAQSQLFGSPRGYVGSHQPGRLEQAAKHHRGVVLEVADLDHAPAHVRPIIADLFISILETGLGQSATGSQFSCASIIFIFTINLPNHTAKGVRKNIGFKSAPSHQEVKQRVVSEIQMMFSSAFLSRVGTPILFHPLDRGSLAAILEKAVKAAVEAAAKKLDWPVHRVVLEPGLGQKLMASLASDVMAFGARVLLEHGRTLAAEAAINLDREKIRGNSLWVSADTAGKIAIVSN